MQWTALGLAGGLSAVAWAGAPAFDCASATSEVEKLICRDDALAALDRRMAETYKAATGKASGDLAKLLRAEQRGWIGGRNDCWKATQPTWLTATWTVSTVRDCVDAQYRLRISELQALWQLLPAKTVSYACNGNAADEVVTTSFASDPPTIRLERGDRTATLWRVPPDAELRYEGQNVAAVQQGKDLKVEWMNTNTGATEALQCTPR